uniref:ERAD-associated E3 ubiquitin-protein ligase component HRD3A-like n=1 Tax=Hirondellea gigas TaxID=1518452 RepID=A0A6A7G815_9CRUS
MPKLGVRRKRSSGSMSFDPIKQHKNPNAEGKKTAEGLPKSAPLFGSFEGFSSTEAPDAKETTSLLPPKESPGSSNRSSPERRREGTALINMTPPPLSSNTPLIPKPGTRTRRKDIPRYVPEDWDNSLPYGGKVYLARKKKPDTWLCIALQVVLVGLAVGLVYYAWYHTDHMHFNTIKLYGHYGHMQAQAITAEKYLHGKGVERNHSMAMVWYKKAADQGHPHSSYNLAVGHLQGLDVGLRRGQAHELIRHAAENGVPEAAEVLNKVCSRTSRCDN